MMNDLLLMSQWLKNPDRKYSDGLSLYLRYKSTPKYDDFLKKGLTNPDAVTSNMLFYRLSQLLRILSSNPALLEKKIIEHSANIKPIGAVKTPGVKKQKISPLRQDKIDPNKLTDAMKDKYKQIQEMVPVIGALHAKLKSSDDTQKNKQLIRELASLDDKKRSLWQEIDLSVGNTKDHKDIPGDTENIKKQIKATRDSLKKRQKVYSLQLKNKPHLANKTLASIEKMKTKLADLEKELKHSK